MTLTTTLPLRVRSGDWTLLKHQEVDVKMNERREGERGGGMDEQ